MKPLTFMGDALEQLRDFPEAARKEAGAFRVIYVARIGDAVYVLHAFQKKTQQTARRDLELAASSLRQIG